jgi:hypothetical protein
VRQHIKIKKWFSEKKWFVTNRTMNKVENMIVNSETWEKETSLTLFIIETKIKAA